MARKVLISLFAAVFIEPYTYPAGSRGSPRRRVNPALTIAANALHIAAQGELTA